MTKQMIRYGAVTLLLLLSVSHLSGCQLERAAIRELLPDADPKLEQRTQLVQAIQYRDLALVQLRIHEGAPVDPPSNCLGNPYARQPPPLGKSSPLVIAVLKGEMEIVRSLIQAGADVNNGSCGYPLHTAIGLGEIDMVHYLVDHGADVNKPDAHLGNTTPLRMALRPAVKATNQLVVVLVENGANVNEAIVPEPKEVYSNCHSTLLHEAVFNLGLDITKYLLDHGANPKAKDGRGRTAADCARARLKIIRVPELRPAIEAHIELLTQYEQIQ